MENVSNETPALDHIVASGVLADDPFVLLDVGCALGIDAAWRRFVPSLVAHGFDPQVDECARLNAAETNSSIRYNAAFVGLPDDHPFHTRRLTPDPATLDYFNPWSRTSAWRAIDRGLTGSREAPEAVLATDRWGAQQLATEKIAVSDYVVREQLRTVDFVKIDTDGSDLEAAISCEAVVRSAEILGFLIESQFGGPHEEGHNTFHHTDRYMKSLGFPLFGITANRYSRAALPQPFIYRAPYNTRGGQPIWGDMLYLRDAGSPQYDAVWQSSLPVTKLLKLVCLFELFELPDCAAEVVVRHRSELASIVNPETLLDLLTPPLRGEQMSYAEYDAAFEDDIEAFYPEPQPEAVDPEPQPEAIPDEPPPPAGGRGLIHAVQRAVASRRLPR